jgi:hypothetical protein
MGTRGAFGVRINGIDKIAYNHFDSYPDGLGRAVIMDIRKMSKDGFNVSKAAIELQFADENNPPTPEQIKRLKHWTDIGVSNQSTADWYCLTRKLQGELYETLKAGLITDAASFLHDSLFCEYAYIVNLDTGMLEFYKGFQETAHSNGRYSAKPDNSRPDNKYFGVALEKEIPLSEIIAMKRESQINKLIESLEPEEKE